MAAKPARGARKKLFYRIGEACKALDIQPYVLRYWETEFPALSPRKSKSGQRVYNERDLAIIERIKTLLYEEGFTIAGAKKKLESELGPGGRLLVSSDPAPEVEETEGGELDSGADERVETLRAGIRAALRETREILARLGDAE